MLLADATNTLGTFQGGSCRRALASLPTRYGRCAPACWPCSSSSSSATSSPGWSPRCSSAEREARPASRRRAERTGRVDAAHGHRAQRAGDHGHDRLLAADVRVRHGRLQYPGPAEALRRHGQRGRVHPQSAGGHGGRRGGPVGGQLPAGRGGHQRRPAGHCLCRAPGQRLLLRLGPVDLHRRLQAVGHRVRAARTT